MKLPWKTMNTNRKPWDYVKSHEATLKSENPEKWKPTKTITNHVTTLKTIKLPWKTAKNNQKPWKPPKKHDYLEPTTVINHENQPKTKKLHWKPRCTMHYAHVFAHFFHPHVRANTQTDSALSLHEQTKKTKTQTNSALSLYIDHCNNQNPHHHHSPLCGAGSS